MRLAPGWYQDIVDFVSAGGSIVDAFAIIAGITLPAWVAPVLAGFGVVSA
ncbi:MAG: class IIc cyclic bacteriocin [Streptococcus suis]